MGQQSAARQTIDIRAAYQARSWLYKADYPRRIDQYIDFFGAGAVRRRTADGSAGVALEIPA